MNEPITERDVALYIAAGGLPSPTVFMQNTYFACRFSGTGCAYRASLDEYALRDPDIWLSPDMCRRIIGVPLVLQHPPGAVLDGPEFAQRCVGVVTLGYAKGDELWCVCRVIDKGVAAMIDKGEFDTSPAVIFEEGSNEVLEFDGYKLLIESDPIFIDHLAVCDRGVWSKGQDEQAGISTSDNTTQSTETST